MGISFAPMPVRVLVGLLAWLDFVFAVNVLLGFFYYWPFTGTFAENWKVSTVSKHKDSLEEQVLT